MRQPPRVYYGARKPHYSSNLRPCNPPENTSVDSDPSIPAEELPDDSFAEDHPIQHPNDSRHEPAASDTPHSADTLYNIKQVLKQRTRKGKKQFLIKWEGYGHQHSSWVDETDVVQTNANEH